MLVAAEIHSAFVGPCCACNSMKLSETSIWSDLSKLMNFAQTSVQLMKYDWSCNIDLLLVGKTAVACNH